jgi:hypothetical protein
LSDDFIDVPGSDFNSTEFVHRVMFQESGDEYANYYFHEIFFGDLPQDERDTMYRDMVQYLYDEYGFEFTEAFDWEDFRAHYEEIS